MVFKRKTVIEAPPDVEKNSSSKRSPSSSSQDSSICNPLNIFLTLCIFVMLIVAFVDKAKHNSNGSSETVAALKGSFNKMKSTEVASADTVVTATEATTPVAATTTETTTPVAAATTTTTTTTADATAAATPATAEAPANNGKPPLEGPHADDSFVKGLYAECDAATWEKFKKFCPSCRAEHHGWCIKRADWLISTYRCTRVEAATAILDQNPECFP